MSRILKVFCAGSEQEKLASEYTVTERYEGFVLAEVPAVGERSTALGEGLTNAIAAFREEASPPLCRDLLVDIATGAEPADAVFLAAVGRALLLSDHQIDVVVTTVR